MEEKTGEEEEVCTRVRALRACVRCVRVCVCAAGTYEGVDCVEEHGEFEESLQAEEDRRHRDHRTVYQHRQVGRASVGMEPCEARWQHPQLGHGTDCT